MSRVDVIRRLVETLSASTPLRGSGDSPAGTWPDNRGPLLMTVEDTTKIERTSLWVGETNGIIRQPYMRAGTLAFRDEYEVDLWGTVGPEPLERALELADAMWSGVVGALAANPALNAVSAAEFGTIAVDDIPARMQLVPTQTGVASWMQWTIRFSEDLT